jgi:hypothetical protein
MDVCRHAVPHIGTCVVVPLSWNNDTPLFRTREALWNQRVSLCAQLVIFAQGRHADIPEAMAYAAGVHDTRTVTHRCRTRHTRALSATIQAIA